MTYQDAVDEIYFTVQNYINAVSQPDSEIMHINELYENAFNVIETTYLDYVLNMYLDDNEPVDVNGIFKVYNTEGAEGLLECVIDIFIRSKRA